MDAIAPNLFAAGSLDGEDGPRLIGARNLQDGTLRFPCPPGMAADEWIAEDLPRTGTLWSFTVQRFRPKTPPYVGPEAFEPFAVGYVELAGAIIVESRIVGVPFGDLRIGMPMKLLTEQVMDASGTGRIGFAFTGESVA